MVNRRRFMGQLQDSRYTELEYIEATGTQYIDTEYICSENTKIEIDFSISAYSIYHSLFGAAGNRTTKRFVGQVLKNVMLITYIGTAYKNPKFEFEIGQRYVLVQSKQMVSLNGTDLGSWSGSMSFTKDTDTSLFLMAINDKSNNTGVFGYKFKGRIYGFKIYENDILAMDLIPVLDSNKVPCFYDKISNELLYNKGTGEFLYAYKQ